jgi:hypothetical protein
MFLTACATGHSGTGTVLRLAVGTLETAQNPHHGGKHPSQYGSSANIDHEGPLLVITRVAA